MADVQLTVTPGTTFTTESIVDEAKLNLAAKPVVTLPEGAGIGPEHMDMDAVTAAVGGAVRGINYLTRPGFWTQDWDKPSGVSCPVDKWTENVLDFFVRPTGAAVAYNRVADGPDTKSLYAVELIGATSNTKVEFVTWVPACIMAMLRGNDCVFSIYLKNMTTDPMFATLFILAADEENSKTAVTNILTDTAVSLVEGEWQRVELTFAAGDYDTIKNGCYIGFSTTNLTGALKSIRVSQPQLELSLVATEWKRPVLPATPRETNILPTEFKDNDKLTGAWLALYLKGTFGLKYLGAPPVLFEKPMLGWNKTGGYPEWQDQGSNKLVFKYNGRDQRFKVPVGATSMRVHCWGAGGCTDFPGASVELSGGVGGYTWGDFTVSAGDEFSVVVGYNKVGMLGRPYGFGGSGQGAAHQHAGGGLSGVFTGTGTVIASQDSRVIAIAGGGGAGGQSGGGANGVQGGNGNDPASSGGESDFQGIDSTGGVSSGNGGGGGGWRGGSGLGLGGKGGTGHLDAANTDGQVRYASTPVLNVPGSTEDEYESPAGRPDHPGLVVVVFSA